MPSSQGQRTVLLCAVGLTPQVVTETLYALAVQRGAAERVVPDELLVITTGQGREALSHTLLGGGDQGGQLNRFRDDFGIDYRKLQLDPERIRLIRDARGKVLPDIQTEEDNAAAADAISAAIRALAADPRVQLLVSIAGGRKTMGYYAGLALSLYGRASDRLYHVLVNPPFESRSDFFYPPPEPAVLQLEDGTTVSTAQARIRLAEIPFVALREVLDAGALEGAATFSDAVALAQQALERPELVVDLTSRQAIVHRRPLRLSDTHFIWLAWFARRAIEKRPPVAFGEEGARDLLGVIDWLEGAGPSTPRTSVEQALAELRGSGATNYFERTRSRLNAAVRERSGLAPRVAEQYCVRSLGRRPRTTYGLTLPPEAIRIEGEP